MIEEGLGLVLARRRAAPAERVELPVSRCCLLYTSDAADERSSVDLGGRRIIKKKKEQANAGVGAIRTRHRLLRQTGEEQEEYDERE